MKKIFAFLAFGLLMSFGAYAQNYQVLFQSNTSFSKLQDGFYTVEFKIAGDVEEHIAGLDHYVVDNPQYFKLVKQVVDHKPTGLVQLSFSERLPWGIWNRVFGEMNVQVIGIQDAQSKQIQMVDFDGFMTFFKLN